MKNKEKREYLRNAFDETNNVNSEEDLKTRFA